MKFWERIRDFRQRLDSERGIVEFDDDGFTLKWDRWPICRPKCQRSVHWDDVRRIDVCMWDAYIGHSVGLIFYDGDEKNAKSSVCVAENRKGYKALLDFLPTRFSGFNQNNVKEIEKCFLGDICFPCWDRDKNIMNLEAKFSEKKIFWTDGSVFWESND